MVLPRSSLMLPINSFIFTSTLFFLGLLIDTLDPFLRCFFAVLLCYCFSRFKTVIAFRAWLCSSLIAAALGGTGLMPFLAFSLQSWESSDDADLGKFVEYFCLFFNHILGEDSSIHFGTNMQMDFSPLKDFYEVANGLLGNLHENLSSLFISSNGRSLMPTFALRAFRTPGLAAYVEDGHNETSLTAEEALSIEERVVTRKRSFVGVTMILLAMMMNVVNLSVPLGVLCIIYYCWGNKIYTYSSDQPSFHSFTDGVYTLDYEVFGLKRGGGIAVAFNGVLHVPYHLTSAQPITISGRTHEPIYANPLEDLVTYGGFPQFVRPVNGEKIYVTLEGAVRRTVSYEVQSSDHGFTYPILTVPGESGSPIWVKRDDQLILCGLAGRWIAAGDGRSEYVYWTSPERPQMMSSGLQGIEPASTRNWEVGVKKVIMHPGAGKTRNVVPQLVESHMADQTSRKKKIRVFILGPTRVVCRELYNALRPRFGNRISLHIKGSGKQSFGNVCIMAHATYYKMYEGGVPEVRSPSAVILDEAHMDDPSTICVRWLVEEMAKNIPVAIMSATLDGEFDERSNFAIHEKKITHVADELVSELEAGRRVGVFLPGMSKTSETRKAIDAALDDFEEPVKVVELSRATYKTVSEDGSLHSPDTRVILMTNIAEVGANLDLDTVIDTSTEFKFLCEDQMIAGTTRNISKASQVQRRGRVGRRKPGRYLYLHDIQPDQLLIPTAASTDAAMLAAGTDYARGDDSITPLSSKQRMVVLEQELSPLYVSQFYSRDGRPLRADKLRDAIADWREGDVRSPCQQSNCPCHGQCKWYDQRVHQQLVSLLTGANIAPAGKCADMT